MPIPDRTHATDYHFLTYSYPGDDAALPWKLSPAVAWRADYCFYSLRTALQGLHDVALQNGVPNVSYQALGAAIRDGGNDFDLLALSFGGGAVQPVREVVITGGVHAREWIAPMMAYLLAEYLIKHYTAQPANRYQTAVFNLINSTRIHVVPLLNPAGNWHSVFSNANGARIWRKNRKRLPATPGDWLDELGNDIESPDRANPPFRNVREGVNRVSYQAPLLPDNDIAPLVYDDLVIDLSGQPPQLIGVDCNRNFNTPRWGYESGRNEEGQPTDPTYFGPCHASEQETRALSGFLSHIQVAAAIDYHSYGQCILYAGEGRQPTATDVSNGRALQTVISSQLNPSWYDSYDYRLGTVFEMVNYRAASSVADYMSLVKNAVAFTIELSPKDQAGGGFNLPEGQIMAVFEANIRGALGFIASAGRQQTQVTAGNWYSRHGVAGTHYADFADWDVFGRGNQLPAQVSQPPQPACGI
jgi:hypothetical protein